MKVDRLKIANIALIILMILNLILVIPASADEKPNYKKMVNEIGSFFDKTLILYKKGNITEAKLNAQAAYFEVFENMEGPIRINISAKKNFELEEEFVHIRNMIKNGEPLGAIEKRINKLMVDLRAAVPELEGGYELIAETADSSDQIIGNENSGANIEPVWLRAVEDIHSELGDALTAYRTGDTGNAKTLVLRAQFDGYKNTLLETAIRRYVSQKKDYENNNSFSEIMGIIHNGESLGKLEMRISSLIERLQGDLPGLPVIEGAVSEREARKLTEKDVPEKDWEKVTVNLFSEIEKAVAVYGRGEQRTAVGIMQDAYFDVFEASGMEAKIGARDAGFKAELEGHFSMIVGQMKKGIPVDDVQETLVSMETDFDKAVNMLGKGADSPMVLFFFSLMIILREGFEAILIITAIIAYLVKTGHKDKLGTIYTGCISALVLSIITAVLVRWVFKVSAASQEILEGATMLLATGVLFSVSYWLISKAEAQKWMAYIKGKVSGSLSSGSLKALWFAAFLAVYREGAETVLFYQALVSDATASGITGIAGGFGIGCVLLVGIYFVMRYGAVRLPIRPFFIFTGALLYYMAFVFAGKGVMELIEGKLFEPSLISWIPTVSFLGVYPYWQTLIPQMLLVSAALAGLVMMRQKSVSVKASQN